MNDFLQATRRSENADLAEKFQPHLVPDPEIGKDPEKYYDKVIELNLDLLEPYIVGPHSPDRARPLSRLAEEAASEGYPKELKAAMIGSCTNSSYEDLGRAASLAGQALRKGAKMKSVFLVSPGSSQVCATAKRDGYLDTLIKAGAKILSNTCGPCIGQWNRTDTKKGEPNSIISSFNRNFPARNDGNPETKAFIASPEVVTAMAMSGSLTFNPLEEDLEDGKGGRFRLQAPEAPSLPPDGFIFDDSGIDDSTEAVSSKQVKIDPESERLQFLTPFEKWDGNDFKRLPLLVKAKGKCTTDHISPAGPWLKYRGHLDNISNNMLTGAVNAFSGETGKGKNLITGKENVPFPDIARHYKSKNTGWIIVGDENYGEGSSREHAAMSPRFLGAKAVITRSMARIHETNLKKQGVLTLNFKNPDDYDAVRESDRISISGLISMEPENDLEVTLHHEDGTEESFAVAHNFNSEQIKWFRAGSALNLVKI